ncbi:dTDP-4-dehydrorhamnose reductase family protein [Flavobacterium restrictum]|uniref:dTDP-4-dehydrorhamnose reductase n=1 Tax=Flavobacterium restrictum TaxID=2594428 RepID=A0A553E555_9FLAO|nr:SDR family oxidoreductase [Flavobacterium restrictum]TRX40139.1 SDR family oxidoreductase [Flavobacterium restrictum]
MRILILGVSGLIGHKLLQDLKKDFEIYATLHRAKSDYGDLPLFSEKNIIENIDVLDYEVLKGVLFAVNPDVILNCVGITKRKINTDNFLDVLMVNSVFPHKLARWAKKNKKRVIHFSTDCVFDGKKGNYDETSLTNAEDLYGRTKALGEINYSHTLTIRSSFIGQELFDKTELLDWFLSQEGKTINGFKKVLYSGVSTQFMASVVKNILLNFPDLSGLYQLAPENAIPKYELLSIAKEAFKVSVTINADEKYVHLPTLDGSKLKNAMDLKIPSWKEMMIDLALNKDFYSYKNN